MVALVLALPSVLSPFFIDEHIQTSKWNSWQRGGGGQRHILASYFVFADAAENERNLEHGLGLWWTAPDLKIAFWRPLAAATHVVDHVLWPGNSVLIHLHGLSWYLALLLALSVLYRRFLPPALASLALALWAWDDARGMLLSWIANRHAIIGAVFGLLALLAHDRWRRDGWRKGAYLGPALFGLGLCASEMAVAAGAFLIGHALFADRGRPARRLVRLLPYVLVVLAWQAVYWAGGYGVAASGGYVNPLVEPLAYLGKLIERAPIYALAQLTPLDSMLWGMYPPRVKAVVFVLAIAVLLAVARLTWPLLAAQPRSRLWLAGAGLALLPICASGTWDRQLVFVGFGAAAALAVLFADVAERPPANRWPRFVVGGLAVFNLMLGPLFLSVKSMTILGMVRMLPSADESVPRDEAITRRTLIVPWASFEVPLWYAWSMRDAAGIPKPRRTRILAVSAGDVLVTRPDPFTLQLRPADGFFASDSSKVFRSDARPFQPGDVVRLPDMVASVVAVTADHRPQTVEFRFVSPLEDPEWLWMRQDRQGLLGWKPPRVGETVIIPALP